MIERTWYYYRNTLQEGPVSESTLRSMITNGSLPNDVLVYCAEISEEWNVASEIEVFLGLGSSTLQQQNVQAQVQHKKTQPIQQRKKTQRIAQPVGNRTRSPSQSQSSRRLARPRLQPTSTNPSQANQTIPAAVQKPAKKKDEDTAMGCGFLIAMVSFIPHLQFLLIFAGIFVFIGCCKYLARWELKKAWESLVGFLIVYGFCFVVAKIVGKIYSSFAG